MAPAGHVEFTVYPVEGVWDLNDKANRNGSGVINKDDLVYDIMIRPPDFVTASYFLQIREAIRRKKPNPRLDEVRFIEAEEGLCLHALHVGPFETEADTYRRMEEFAGEQGLFRASKLHREIYLTDFRRTAPEQRKSVLRCSLKTRPA